MSSKGNENMGMLIQREGRWIQLSPPRNKFDGIPKNRRKKDK